MSAAPFSRHFDKRPCACSGKYGISEIVIRQMDMSV